MLNLVHHLLRYFFCAIIFATLSAPATATISIQDDSARIVTLSTPARRIVSLAPHATELLFAIGAGAQLVGVSDYSNYPPAANSVAHIGSATALDMERLLSLRPDLIVTWGASNGQLTPQINQLRALGIAVFDSDPKDFATIATALERLGKLTGHEDQAHNAASQFRTRWQSLQTQHANRPSVSVFYQVWHQPLMTLNDAHLVSAVIRLCGGRNIFGHLSTLVPTVNLEAVLAADPEVILSGSSRDDTPSDWLRLSSLTAVRRGNLYKVNSDWLARPGPRILDGAQAVCEQLDKARTKRVAP